MSTCILHIYSIYIYVGAMISQPLPHIFLMDQSSMGFRLAPKPLLDARSSMFFPPKICSVIYFRSRLLQERRYD